MSQRRCSDPVVHFERDVLEDREKPYGNLSCDPEVHQGNKDGSCTPAGVQRDVQQIERRNSQDNLNLNVPETVVH
jgi:hypothetical protein